MSKQTEMFGDRYARFEAEHPLPDGYPKGSFKPLHPDFARAGNVTTPGATPTKYYVDMTIGECECDNGFAFAVNTMSKRGGWYERGYCIHKLRMLSVITEDRREAGLPPEVLLPINIAYLKALGSKYNKYEVVSAFHKELRRGDFQKAWFWGLILSTQRGMRGVFQYLLNIIYEETRDHDLADFLLKCRSSVRMHSLSIMCRAISWFCATPKKWELTRRYAIFQSEMRGYKALVKDYSPDVAKGGNVIPADQRDKLLKHMQAGARKGDLVQFQRGLKGLQKLQYAANPGADQAKGADKALQVHRFWIYEQLYALGEELHGDSHDMWRVVSFVNARIDAEQGIGYHELNAIGDALMGEPADAGLLDPKAHKRAIARPTPPVPLFLWPPIPIYAQDNHTWTGKRLMQRHPEQLKPGAKQTDLDFRYCGAYFGVAYRMICQQQHGNVNDIEWADVKWDTELYNIVMSLWY